ncbi:MAG: hypothetical protein ABIZ80_04215, partial [Bryobacteraceae bacterium]
AISAYPLGVRQGSSAKIALRGFNLGSGKVEVKGQPSSEDEHAVIFRPDAPSGHAFSKVKLALGNDPEVESSSSNASLSEAQTLALPVTVNGRLDKPANYFRFKAKKGEKLVLEVAANRLGSPLDSTIEVQDARGKPVERATVRCLTETNVVLRDHDSVAPGIRIQSPLGLAVGDLLMIDSEIVQIDAMPRTPDDDMRFVAFNGQRQAILDTTSEAHANDSRVYKVQIHPAGAQFASNGLPLVRLAYRNDDGGPGYEKDSRLNFTAPADGEYFVKLSDVRALAGEEFAYRLSIHAPAPDFQLTVTPRNPNVPVGGRIPLTVTAMRMDGFQGPIDIEVPNLPAGLHATKGVIAVSQVSTTLLLSADENAKLTRSAAFQLNGSAKIGGKMIVHAVSPGDLLKLISVTPRADILMTSMTREITLEPGGTAEVAVSIQRNNQFGGRVPVEIRNLPPGVRVLDVGLNGVLLNENEQTRTFRLEALPSAQPVEQTVYVSGNVETRAGMTQQNVFAGEPILLRLKAKTQISGGTMPSAFSQPSAVK